MKIAKIYKISNTVNDKVYIGFTTLKYTSTRFARHVYNASLKSLRYNSKLYNAINKYGKENFFIEEIYCSKDLEYALKIIEPLFIKEYDSYNTGYNTSLGGEGRLGAKQSEEFCKNLSIRTKNKKHSDEVKLKISKSSPNAKKYEILYPDGTYIIIKNLSAFCRDNKVSFNLKFNGNAFNNTRSGFKIRKHDG